MNPRVDRPAPTTRAVVERHLARIAADDHGAWITLDADAALARADALDARRAAGEPLGSLAGLTVAIKDNIMTRALPTTCGSRLLADPLASPLAYDATVVTRLLAADAIVLGKTNLDAFGMGSSTEHGPAPARNPHDPTRTAGGSSGGSAAAVAAGHCHAALGSDTGGSVRQPAAFCGLVGLAPTYGRVSRFGLVAHASSLDRIGPLAPDVRTCAALYAAIAGPDPRDATTADRPVDRPLFAAAARLDGLRVGCPPLPVEPSPAVAAAHAAALDRLTALGATLTPIDLPSLPHALAAYRALAAAEAASNLARFDTVRYGRRVEAPTYPATVAAGRGAGFGPEVRRRILLGTHLLTAGHAALDRARALRRRLTAEHHAALDTVDLIATPTAPTVAFPLGARRDDPLALARSDAYTVAPSLAGLPALSLPAPVGALPVGLQLIGRPFDEATLLQTAAALEDHP